MKLVTFKTTDGVHRYLKIIAVFLTHTEREDVKCIKVIEDVRIEDVLESKYILLWLDTEEARLLNR